MLGIRMIIAFLTSITMALSACSVARNTNTIRIELAPTSQASKTAVKGKSFRGTILNREAYVFLSDSNSIQRINLNMEDIQKTEIAFRRQIKALNHGHENQIAGCPIIEENLNNYFRQYVGFVNSKGQKVVHINFYWDKYTLADKLKGNTDRRLNFESDYAIVFDGCSYFWQVNINLTTGKLYGFSVNGIS